MKNMDDHQEEQVVSESLVPEERPSSSVSTEQPEEAENQEGKEAESSQEQQEQGEIKAKSRLEKRINSLEEKLEGAKTPEDKERIAALLDKLKGKLNAFGKIGFQRQPLVLPEDAEEGLDPNLVNQRFNQNLEAVKEEVKKEIQAQQQFESTVREHMDDVQKTIGQNPELNPESDQYDKDLHQFVEAQYLLANSVYNPFSGQTDLLPSIKYSEIYNRVKKILEKRTTLAQAEVSGKIARSAQVSSTPVSGSATEETDIEALKSELWQNPEKVASELEKRLQK